MATQFTFANLFTDYLNIEQSRSYTHLILILFIFFLQILYFKLLELME